MKAFVAKHKIFCLTVGVGEGVYTPYGWIIAEKTGSGDVFGMCLRGVVPCDKECGGGTEPHP